MLTLTEQNRIRKLAGMPLLTEAAGMSAGYGFDQLSYHQKLVAIASLTAYMEGPWEWDREDRDDLAGYEDADNDDVFDAYMRSHQLDITKLTRTEISQRWKDLLNNVSDVASDAVRYASNPRAVAEQHRLRADTKPLLTEMSTQSHPFIDHLQSMIADGSSEYSDADVAWIERGEATIIIDRDVEMYADDMESLDRRFESYGFNEYRDYEWGIERGDDGAHAIRILNLSMLDNKNVQSILESICGPED